MSTNSLEGKLEAIDVSHRVLIAYFKNTPQIEGVLYKDMGVPDFIYEMTLTLKNKVERELRISKVSERLDIDKSEVRKLMIEYSLKELETAYKRNNKVVVRNVLNYVRDTE